MFTTKVLMFMKKQKFYFDNFINRLTKFSTFQIYQQIIFEKFYIKFLRELFFLQMIIVKNIILLNESRHYKITRNNIFFSYHNIKKNTLL